MINKTHKIALVTDDVEGAVSFYTETLGLEVMERFPAEDDEGFVFLKAGNYDFGADAEKNDASRRRVPLYILPG